MICARSLFIISVVKPGSRVVLPDATLRFEFFAQCGDRRSVAAGAPLRNHGDLGFAGLGTERGWSGECRDGTGK